MSKVIAHYMPDACGGRNCPAPEIWAAVVNEDLPANECARLEEHAQDCAYCTVERRLAEDFIDMPEATANADVAWIVERMSAASGVPATNVVPLRPRRRRILPALIGLAAAAMLILAFAPMLPLTQPALVVPVTDDIVRGTDIAPVQPVGEVAAVPAQLQWTETGAARFRVTISDVAGDTIWAGYTDKSTTIAIPAEVRERLQRAVVYYWRIEGLDESGRTTAQSPRTSFRVQP